MQEKNKKGMNVDQAVLAMAGAMIVITVVLGLLWTKWALAFTLFVGVNMLQAAFTGFCPAAMIFSRLGIQRGCAFGKDR